MRLQGQLFHHSLTVVLVQVSAYQIQVSVFVALYMTEAGILSGVAIG